MNHEDKTETVLAFVTTVGCAVVLFMVHRRMTPWSPDWETEFSGDRSADLEMGASSSAAKQPERAPPESTSMTSSSRLSKSRVSQTSALFDRSAQNTAKSSSSDRGRRETTKSSFTGITSPTVSTSSTDRPRKYATTRSKPVSELPSTYTGDSSPETSERLPSAFPEEVATPPASDGALADSGVPAHKDESERYRRSAERRPQKNHKDARLRELKKAEADRGKRKKENERETKTKGKLPTKAQEEKKAREKQGKVMKKDRERKRKVELQLKKEDMKAREKNVKTMERKYEKKSKELHPKVQERKKAAREEHVKHEKAKPLKGKERPTMPKQVLKKARQKEKKKPLKQTKPSGPTAQAKAVKVQKKPSHLGFKATKPAARKFKFPAMNKFKQKVLKSPFPKKGGASADKEVKTGWSPWRGSNWETRKKRIWKNSPALNDP
ncbi:unnamed protein product [Soboliphyme baturini]|uniref:Nucleolar protein 58-like n=1 Tax=Soboliphyme baturini TaxID=241478 RepID=A0A183IUY6_9BILA|nr:unnamed protein product [Soboliphyme baturini]